MSEVSIAVTTVFLGSRKKKVKRITLQCVTPNSKMHSALAIYTTRKLGRYAADGEVVGREGPAL